MTHLNALRSPLDSSGLPHPAVPVDPPLPLMNTYKITGEDVHELFNRLQPYLPSQFEQVAPSPSGIGLLYHFSPFTGREGAPVRPDAFWEDPRLTWVSRSEDAREHKLREAAAQILDEIYEEAQGLWRNATYVDRLRQVEGDAPKLWRVYLVRLGELHGEYRYLRTPQASAEWHSAVSRLVDAQDRARTAAEAFESRRTEIVAIGDKWASSELLRSEALSQAGYEDGGEPWLWHDATREIDDLIKEQNTHLAKVAQLTGPAAA